MARARRSTVLTGVVLGAAACAAVQLAAVASNAAPVTHPAASAAGGTPESVIVFLSHQDTAPVTRANVATRRVDAASVENAVVSRAAAVGARKPTNVVHYTSVDAVSMTVTPAQAAALAADSSVARVIKNTKLTVAPPRPADPRGITRNARSIGQPDSTAVCPTDPSKPLLEPEALQDTHTASDDPSDRTAQQLTNGSGVKIGYIADAINPDSPDFIRANGQHVITDYKAFSADGPTPTEGGAEAYGDASAIAAQGLVPHDLSTFVNPAYPLPSGCNIRILGMAPGASIVALKSDLYTTSIIQAIDYATTTDKVDVLNESFGGAPIPDAGARSAIAQFDDAAVRAGITVTVSSGDAGTTSTIGSPATDPNVISVAADTNSRGSQQTGYAGARAFGNGKWVNDQISSLSSGGFTQSGGTVDLAAPGEAGWAVCDAGSPECANYRGSGSDFQLFGGTSQSAPLTAGAAALVISAYRSTHHGKSPSPSVVKRILTSTATDLGLPAFEQGAGLLNSRAAVEAALTYPGGGTPAPAAVHSNVVLSKNAADLSGAPGSTVSTTFGVTNVGTKALTVVTGTRNYATTKVSTINTSIDSTSTQTFPYPTNGAPWAYKKVPFTVPSGADRLATQMIWQGAAKQVGSTTVTPVVRVSLFDPSGTYVANSRPQGGAVSANYANLDVRRPVAGTWTAVIYTASGATGYTGNVSLRNTFQDAVPVGRVNHPALHLAPGRSANVTGTFTVPSGGDTSYSITVASSDGQRTSLPVVIRSVVPTRGGKGSFSGTITGGNARAGSAAQVFTYAFDVPKRTTNAHVDLTLADDPSYTLETVLVDPHDETQAIDSNSYTGADGNISGRGTSLQLNAANPVAGRWRIIVLVVNPVPGKAFTEGFTGTISYNRPIASSTLPQSYATKLTKGATTTARVRVRNTGKSPIVVQVDPRTSEVRTQQLTSPFGPQSVQLPSHNSPTFLVPPGTKSLIATSVADVPAIVDLLDGTQGIDQVGDLAAGKKGATVSVARVTESSDTVGTGVWYTDLNEVGPVGDGGAPAADARVDLSAKTPLFDPTVTSSTGDFWSVVTDPSADTGKPVTIAAGQSATITVSIKPTAKKGTHVTGQLFVYTPPSFAYSTFNTTGDTLAVLPYRYTVN